MSKTGDMLPDLFQRGPSFLEYLPAAGQKLRCNLVHRDTSQWTAVVSGGLGDLELAFRDIAAIITSGIMRYAFSRQFENPSISGTSADMAGQNPNSRSCSVEALWDGCELPVQPARPQSRAI